MFKKFCIAIFAFAVASCSSPVYLRGGIDDGSFSYDEITIDPDTKQTFRVGVMLPLTGEAAKHGKGLKNAALMAMEDINNPNLVLQFYDTKSTPAGSRIAIENALSQKVDMVVGPLMSSSLQSIADRVEEEGVPVIAFSTSEEVLRPGIYTLGLLIDEQVNRIMTYAADKGRKNFALLVPDNRTGIAVAKSAVKAAIRNDVVVSNIAFYPPNTTDFSGVLKQMTNYTERSEKVKKMKKNLAAAAKNGDEAAAVELKKLERFDTIDDVEFDAVLIPESGARLKSAIAMFGYYDVSGPKVKFLGTSLWESTSLSNESVAIGSWFPALSRIHSSYFLKKYNDTFSEKPSALSSLAYDAIALANAMSAKNKKYIKEYITTEDGYIGISGVFRIYENGSNEHSLDIYEVRRNGNVVVSAAPKKLNHHEMRDLNKVVNVDSSYMPPKIFGKDEVLAQSLIYGKVLPKPVEKAVEPEEDNLLESVDILY
ncbi:MAG: penicillin-binding protein activator [Lactobacillus sp.]|nr:penicillin-binding protein activator [Lactobacillus sp.]